MNVLDNLVNSSEQNKITYNDISLHVGLQKLTNSKFAILNNPQDFNIKQLGECFVPHTNRFLDKRG